MKKFIVGALALAPFLASAQAFGNVRTLLTSIGGLINTALPIVLGLAILGFFWGLAMFIFKAGDPDKQKEARSIMIWSIVALFVMVSIWGLVNFLGQALGVGAGTGNNPANSPVVPTVQIR